MRAMAILAMVLAALVVTACASNSQAGDSMEKQGDAMEKKDGGAMEKDSGMEKEGSKMEKNDLFEEFTDLLSARSRLEWKVSYDINTKALGQELNLKSTQYIKGAEMMRMDSAFQGTETRVYIDHDVYTSCSNTGPGWNCFKVTNKDQESTGSQDFEEDFKSEPSKYNIVKDGTMSIAGTTATCYKLTTEDSTARYCYSSEAVPLYIKVDTKDGSTEMRATSYSKTVADSDFDLPAGAEAKEMGDIQNDPCAGCNYLSGSSKEACLSSCAN